MIFIIIAVCLFILYFKKKDIECLGWGMIFTVVGIILLMMFNINNAGAYRTGKAKTEMYQEMVDNSRDDRLAQGGYDKVLYWNDHIISSRYYQDHFYFCTHHLYKGDWNEIPLVTFNKSEVE